MSLHRIKYTVPPRRSWAEINHSKGCLVLQNWAFVKQIGTKNLSEISKKRKIAKSHSQFIFIELPAKMVIKNAKLRICPNFQTDEYSNIRRPSQTPPVRYEKNHWAKVVKASRRYDYFNQYS
jgi:hypothetical protein